MPGRRASIAASVLVVLATGGVIASLAPRSLAQHAHARGCAALEAAFVGEARVPDELETTLHAALRASDACVARVGPVRGPLSTRVELTLDATGSVVSVAPRAPATHARPALDRCLVSALRGVRVDPARAGQTLELWIVRGEASSDGMCPRAPIEGYRLAVAGGEMIEGEDTGLIAAMQRHVQVGASRGAPLPSPPAPFTLRITLQAGSGTVTSITSDAPESAVAPVREWLTHLYPEVYAQTGRIVVEISIVGRPVPPFDLDDGRALAPEPEPSEGETLGSTLRDRGTPISS